MPPFTLLLQLMRFCRALLTNSEGKDEQVSGFCCLLWTLYHVPYFFSLSNEGVMKEEHSLPARLHVAAMAAGPFVVQTGVCENHRNVITVLCVCVCVFVDALWEGCTHWQEVQTQTGLAPHKLQKERIINLKALRHIYGADSGERGPALKSSSAKLTHKN